jgi:hypothetical protein
LPRGLRRPMEDAGGLPARPSSPRHPATPPARWAGPGSAVPRPGVFGTP